MGKLKLTDEMITELCKLKSAGMSNKSVCDGVGISEPAFYDWYKKGTADLAANKNTQMSKFLKSYKKAEVAHKLKRIKVIQESADEGNWQAAAWELERCYPSEYGKRVHNEVTGKDGSALQTKVTGEIKVKSGLDFEKLTDEELELLNELLSKSSPK